jgi:hypothetical protein
MYSNSVIVLFVVNAICVRMLVGEVTVNDDALLSLLSSSFFFAMSLYTDRVCVCVCVHVCGERQRKPRVANSEGKVRGKQTRTQESESKRDRTAQG